MATTGARWKCWLRFGHKWARVSGAEGPTNDLRCKRCGKEKEVGGSAAGGVGIGGGAAGGG